MSLESVTIRREKRIIEYIISGFTNAKEAIVFGNTVHSMVLDKIGVFKYEQLIAAPNTAIAITEDWVSNTILKSVFLEVKSQNDAMYIKQEVCRAVKNHSEIYAKAIKIEQEIVREKPQAQSISLEYIPKTSQIKTIGKRT